jgi:hypothetical protein
LNLPEILKQD